MKRITFVAKITDLRREQIAFDIKQAAQKTVAVGGTFVIDAAESWNDGRAIDSMLGSMQGFVFFVFGLEKDLGLAKGFYGNEAQFLKGFDHPEIAGTAVVTVVAAGGCLVFNISGAALKYSWDALARLGGMSGAELSAAELSGTIGTLTFGEFLCRLNSFGMGMVDTLNKSAPAAYPAFNSIAQMLGILAGEAVPDESD